MFLKTCTIFLPGPAYLADQQSSCNVRRSFPETDRALNEEGVNIAYEGFVQHAPKELVIYLA